MFSWKELLDVISLTLSYSDEKRPALAARVQMLQKPPYSFPSTERVGRGGRAAYSLDHALKLIYFFKLLEIAVPPAQAIRLISEEWPMLASATGDAINSPRDYPHGTFLLVRVGGGEVFREPGKFPVPDPRESDPDNPYRIRGILDLSPSELVTGLAGKPDWFDCTALIWVGSVANALLEQASKSEHGTAELLTAARSWVAN